MNTFQDLIHQFKTICQLFVHVAVHKPEDRHDVMERLLEQEYFSFPLQITRRKLGGMRDSLVASSVWRPEFKQPLETYPHYEAVQMDFATPGCDACHLGRRVSTILGRVYGSAYDRLGFEPTEDDSEDDSDSEERRRDSSEEISNTKAQFNLGRFCAARTRMYHAFSHWEYTTFKVLLHEVDHLRGATGSHGFVRVAFAGGAKPPKDLSDADGVMDWLDQRGIIAAEWQRIKTMMDKARKLEGKKGDDDDDLE